VDRVHGRAYGLESPLGWMPRFEDLDVTGLDKFGFAQFDQLMEVDRDAWKRESLLHEELFLQLVDKLPREMVYERELLVSRLWRSPRTWHMAPEIPD
jgi:phosphoenolpyruvate carboxykinase (GTP)